MGPAHRAIAPLFAAAYDVIGEALMVGGLVLRLAARAIRRDLARVDHEAHADAAPPVEDRKAADLYELRDLFAKARRANPERFEMRPPPFGFAPRRNDPNAN